MWKVHNVERGCQVESPRNRGAGGRERDIDTAGHFKKDKAMEPDAMPVLESGRCKGQNQIDGG